MSLSDNISNRNKNNGNKKSAEAAASLVTRAERRTDQRRVPYFDHAANVQRYLGEWNQRIVLDENIKHINVSMNSLSDLGRTLSLDFNLEWLHPEFGRFLSITSFWHFISGSKSDDRLRRMRSYDLHTLAHETTGTTAKTDIPNYRAMILMAIYERIKFFPGLREMVVESTLPFDNYLVARNNMTARRTDYAVWLVPGLEIIRYALKHDVKPDFEDFALDDLSYRETVARIKGRPRVGQERKSGQDLTAFLSTGTIKPPEPKADKPKAKGKAKGKKKPDAAVVQEVGDELDEGVWKRVAKKYLSAAESAVVIETIFYRTHADAMDFVWRATRAMVSSDRVDVEPGNGFVASSALEIPIPEDVNYVVFILDLNGVTVIRTGDAKFHNPYNSATGNEVAEYRVDEDEGVNALLNRLHIPPSLIRRIGEEVPAPKKTVISPPQKQSDSHRTIKQSDGTTIVAPVGAQISEKAVGENGKEVLVIHQVTK